MKNVQESMVDGFSGIVSLPLISVFMTVRNGIPLLREAVESVSRQSYLNWELIVVDDGSTDGTLDYLMEVAHSDSRIKVIRTGGVGRARALNIALRECRGLYFSNLDADDLYHPARLEVCASAVSENNHVEFLYTDTVVFSDVSPFVSAAIEPISKPGGTLRDVTSLMLTKSLINHSAVFILRSVFERVGLYDESRKAQLDYDLWYRIAQSGIRIYKLDARLSGKRVHEGQSFERKDRLRYVCSAYKLKSRYLTNVNAAYGYRLLAFIFFLYSLLPGGFRYRAKTAYDWFRR